MEIKGNNTKNEAAMKYQNIYIHLYDGRIITATVPEFIGKDEKLIVECVQVLSPKELPEDCHFEELKK